MMHLLESAKKYLLLFFAAAIIGTSFYMVFITHDLFSHIQNMTSIITELEEKTLEDQVDQNKEVPEDPITFLVYGVDAGVWEDDQEGEEKGNADTIVMASIDPGKGSVVLLSIPRDTLASIPGYNQTKINHAHSYGGSELLVETVEEFTGCQLDYYVGFDFQAFINIVDLMGGIEFYLDRDFVFSDSLLEAGQQKLDGEKAFAVIQSRQDPMGDVDRVKRQQQFLGAMIEKVGDMSLEELFFLGMVAWDQVNTNLDIMTGLSLAGAFTDFSLDNIEMEVLPGRFINIDEITYWEVDPTQKEEIIKDLFYTDEDGGVEAGG